MTIAVLGCAGRDPDALPGAGGQEGEGEPPQVRTLTRAALFGALPVDNRVLDPLLTFTGSGAFFFRNDGFAGDVARYDDPSTPTRTPSLELRALSGGQTVALEVKAKRGPLLASVWLGSVDDDALAGVDVALTGLFPSSGESAVPLTAADDEPVRQGDVVWRRFEAALEDGPIGWALLMVSTSGAPTAPTVRVAGPVVVDGPAAPNALVRSAAPRPLSDLQRRIGALAAEQARQRLLLRR